MSKNQEDRAESVRAVMSAYVHKFEGGYTREPASEEMIQEAKQAGTMPLELEAFYAIRDGSSSWSAEIFDLDEREELFVSPSQFAQEISGAAVFGGDGSGYLFFIDTTNELGRGEGAIFAVDKIYRSPDKCRYCSPDFASFLEAIQQDRTPWIQPPR